MRSIKLKLLLIIVFASSIYNIYAQNKGKVTAILKDAQTHESIPYATAILLNQQTKNVVQATQTDSNGSLVIGNLPDGVFELKISFIGYDPMIRENIILNTACGVLDLGSIEMRPVKNKVLNEIMVTAKKSTLQNTDEKKVFSVNQSLVSEGGTAADVLQNVPTLQVDADGNVNFRGSASVKVLIDGKTSLIAGGDISQILQSIPASSIETVEVIANPAAKYDSDGQSIINIVLKKNRKLSFNASEAITIGTRNNYNSSTTLSYENSQVNLYGNYSVRSGDTFSNGFQNLTYINPGDVTMFSNENFYSTTSNKIQNVKVGVDYFITPKSTLSISGTFNSRDTHRDEILNINNLSTTYLPLLFTNRENITNNDGRSYGMDINYSQHFKNPKEELVFDLGFSYSSYHNFQTYQSKLDSLSTSGETSASLLKNDIVNSTTNYNIQADYTLPVGKAGQFSAGYRSQITLGTNNQYAYNLSDAEQAIYGLTDFFKGNNQVHAIYLSYQNQIDNFIYQVGVRGEDASLSGTLMGYDVNNSPYFAPVNVASKGLYPSLFLTQKFPQNQQLRLSFTRRVSRPTSREFNPSTDFSDPTNYETGNPYLLPESINSAELGFNKIWQNISLTSSIYYNQLNNVIKHIESPAVNGVIITTSQNLKRSVNTGLELIGHFAFIKSWDFTANANIYERENSAAPQFGISANNGLSWNANITNNVNLVKNLSIQIRTDYRAADIVIQDRNRAAFGLDAGAKYDFKGKKASLSLNSKDVFNSRKWAFLRESDTVLMDFERRTLSSRASLTFAYRFGSAANPAKIKKVEEKQDKRVDDAS